MSKQPRDDSNYPIPVLSYLYNGGQQIILSGGSSISTEFAKHTRVISLYATTDCFFEIGNVLTIANISNSHFLPAGVYIDLSLGADTNAALNAKYLAAITAGGEGLLYISERI